MATDQTKVLNDTILKRSKLALHFDICSKLWVIIFDVSENQRARVYIYTIVLVHVFIVKIVCVWGKIRYLP